MFLVDSLREEEVLLLVLLLLLVLILGELDSQSPLRMPALIMLVVPLELPVPRQHRITADGAFLVNRRKSARWAACINISIHLPASRCQRSRKRPNRSPKTCSTGSRPNVSSSSELRRWTRIREVDVSWNRIGHAGVFGRSAF